MIWFDFNLISDYFGWFDLISPTKSNQIKSFDTLMIRGVVVLLMFLEEGIRDAIEPFVHPSHSPE